MRSVHSLLSLPLLCVGLLAAAQEKPPVASTETPKQDKVAPRTEAPDPQPVPDTDTRRRALQMLADAEAANDAGQVDRALSIARDALKLYPQSKAIAGFIASVQSVVSPVRGGNPIQNRAKAHLAAALTRAQVLMQQRRFSESLDLLNGIIEAAKLFPASASVSLYHDLAHKELLEYRIGVQSGRIRPANESVVARPADTTPPTPTDSDATAPAAAPSLSEFPTAPTNAYRLAKLAKEQTPAWYNRLRTSLSRVMSVDYRNMPLGLVLDDIKQTTGVEIIVDTPVQAARTTTLASIDLRASTIPAETILSLACQVAGCEYVLLEKGVVITTSDKAGDYVRQLPESVQIHWSRARQLFPDLYLDAVTTRPLPEVTAPDVGDTTTVPTFLRSGRDLVADIQSLLR